MENGAEGRPCELSLFTHIYCHVFVSILHLIGTVDVCQYSTGVCINGMACVRRQSVYIARCLCGLYTAVLGIPCRLSVRCLPLSTCQGASL